MSSSISLQADKVEEDVETIASLQKKLDQATTYAEWRKIALRLDELTGKYCNASNYSESTRHLGGLRNRFTCICNIL